MQVFHIKKDAEPESKTKQASSSGSEVICVAPADEGG